MLFFPQNINLILALVSFYQPSAKENIAAKEDRKFFMKRTEK